MNNERSVMMQLASWNKNLSRCNGRSLSPKRAARAIAMFEPFSTGSPLTPKKATSHEKNVTRKYLPFMILKTRPKKQTAMRPTHCGNLGWSVLPSGNGA